MGKKANIVKPRTCGACGRQFETDSKGLKEHFKACCKAKRKEAAA